MWLCTVRGAFGELAAYPSLSDDSNADITCTPVTLADATNVARLGYYLWRLAKLIK